MKDHTKLDNPAWHSLNETHRPFAISNDEIKFYLPEICPFGGMLSPSGDLGTFIHQHTDLNSFFIIGNKPLKTDGLVIINELVCLQMTCMERIEIKIDDPIIELTGKHKEQLIYLVNLVQPGYFKEGTTRMGDYFGIFKDGKLVAVTGERMRMHDYTEISAVVTHPGYTGKGFAKQLITHTANKNITQNIIPYLHVTETNLGAIALYEKLGFTTRRKISLWMIKMEN
jgi:GNAT superfamily N-acetyltransferase